MERTASGEYVNSPSSNRLIIPDPLARGCTSIFGAYVSGDCLVPSGIRPGNGITIGRGIQPRNGEIASVRVSKRWFKRYTGKSCRRGERPPSMIKHFYRQGGRVLLATSNPAHPSILLPARSVKVEGVVVSVHDGAFDGGGVVDAVNSTLAGKPIRLPKSWTTWLAYPLSPPSAPSLQPATRAALDAWVARGVGDHEEPSVCQDDLGRQWLYNYCNDNELEKQPPLVSELEPERLITA